MAGTATADRPALPNLGATLVAIATIGGRTDLSRWIERLEPGLARRRARGKLPEIRPLFAIDARGLPMARTDGMQRERANPSQSVRQRGWRDRHLNHHLGKLA
jgi:hypothetical protein